MTISKITPQSQAPYYDDWDETKNYNQILFRPGFAVQTRELNQLQTAIQSQLDYLGQYTFRDGARILDGDIVTNSHSYVKLTSIGDDLSGWVGKEITGGTTGVTAEVLRVESDPTADVLYVRYSNTGTDNITFEFAAGETLTGTDVSGTVGSSNETGNGSFITIKEGIYFSRGYYVYIEDQTLVLDPFDTTPSFEVGFVVSSDIITSSDDSTINDNSSGTPNSGAPGAHRLSVTGTISKLALDADTGEYDGVNPPTNWIPHTRVINGIISDATTQNLVDTPLSDRLEKRTYEESGDYALRPFGITVRDHLRLREENGVINNGYKWPSQGGNPNKFVIKVDPSTAYIRGRRVEKAVQETLDDLRKPRYAGAIKTYANGKTIGITLGSYFIVDTVRGLPEVDNFASRQRNRLWNAAGTKIGSCRVRGIESDSQSSGYRVYVFDVLIDSGYSIDDAKFFASDQPDISGSPTYEPGDDSPYTQDWFSVITQGLTDAAGQGTIIPLPFDNTKTISVSSVNNTVYRSRITLQPTSIGGGSATFTLPTGTELNDTNDMFYSLHKDNTSPRWSTPEDAAPLTTAVAGATSIVITDADIDANAVGARLTITVVNDPAVRGQKTKTKRKYYMDTVTYATSTSKYELEHADICDVKLIFEELNSSSTTVDGAVTNSYTFDVASTTGIEVDDLVLTTPAYDGEIQKVVYVKEINGSTITVGSKVTLSDTEAVEFKSIVNHTDKFIIDLGQRREFYDLGSITRRATTTASDISNGDLHIMYDYFHHTGTGDYFCVDSYPNYDDIPSFEEFKLRDCLDFRPVHANRSGANNLPANSSDFAPAPGYGIDVAHIEIYMGRKDKLYLNKNGEYIYKEGRPSLNPQPPSNVPVDSMLLYDIEVDPYVYDVRFDVRVSQVNNESFTMEELRGIKYNLEQLQYYVANNINNINSAPPVGDPESPRTNKGFATDNFEAPTGPLSLADPNHPDFKIGYGDDGKLTPAVETSSIRLVNKNGGVQTAWVWNAGNFATSAVTDADVVEINQGVSTEDWTINENGVTSFGQGNINLVPRSDTYGSENSDPEPVNNQWIIYEYAGIDTGYGYSGVPIVDSEFQDIDIPMGWTTPAGNSSSLAAMSGTVYRVNSETRQVQAKYRGSSNWLTVSENLTTNLDYLHVYAGIEYLGRQYPSWGSYGFDGWSGTVVRQFGRFVPVSSSTVNDGLIPMMRSRYVYFQADNLRPGSQVYPFFDGVYIGNLAQEVSQAQYDAQLVAATESAGQSVTIYDGFTTIGGGASALIADASGRITGRFLVPNNADLRVPAGIARFELTSGARTTTEGEVVIREDLVTSYASAEYYSGTYIPSSSETSQPTEYMPGTSNFDNISSTSDLTDFENWNTDAVAQTFTIENDEGCFASSIDVYFSAKDSSNLPITARLVRTDDDGRPTRQVIDGTTNTLLPSDITSIDGTTATNIGFAYPVYLTGGNTYALILTTNSGNYSVRVARAGSTYAEGSGGNAYRNRSTGSLLTSTNNSNWTVRNNVDMKFTLKRCAFQTGTTQLEVVNDVVDSTQLSPNPFRVISVSTGVSATIRVTHPHHGMYGSGHTVVFEDANDFNQITAAEIEDASGFAVSNQTLNTYEVTIPFASGTDPINNRDGGGWGVRARGNVMYDFIYPLIDGIRPDGTDVDFEIRGTTGESQDSSGLSFGVDSSFFDVESNAWNIMDDPKVLLSEVNQSINGLSGRSLTGMISLTTESARVSPTVDLSRLNAETMQYLIDDPSTGPSDANAIDSATTANYITKRIQIDTIEGQIPTALDVFLDVNKPEGADVEIWYKTNADQVDDGNEEDTESEWNELGWTQITHNTSASGNIWSKIEPSVIPDSADPYGAPSVPFTEVKWTVEDTSASGAAFSFTQMAIKIVLRSNNSANSPSVKNLRIVASR